MVKIVNIHFNDHLDVYLVTSIRQCVFGGCFETTMTFSHAFDLLPFMPALNFTSYHFFIWVTDITGAVHRIRLKTL